MPTGNGRTVLVLDPDDATALAGPIVDRGYAVHTATSLSDVHERRHPPTDCVVGTQSVAEPVTQLVEGIDGADSAFVFVYDDHRAAATALDAGAEATVPRGEPEGGWRHHLGAAVERVIRGQAMSEDSLVSRTLDELPEILFVVGVDGRLLRWNDRLCELTGYTDEEIRGMQPRELFEGRHLDRVERGIGRIVMNGEATVVAELTTPSGEAVPHAFTGSLIDVNGTQPIVGTARDIRDRRERERELAAQTDELETVNHVNAIIRDVMGILLTAETSHELVAEVCDRLTAEDAYRLGWIASYDTDIGRVEPDAWAGQGAAYLAARPTGEGDDATDTYTLGPVEYARPDVPSTFGGGMSLNNVLWRKVNGETVTKTVVGLDTS